MFHAVPRLERVHPLEGGLFRRKVRRDRRAGMKLENHVSFYSRYAWEMLSKHVRFIGMYLQYRGALKRALRDKHSVIDTAMTPVEQSEFAMLEMYSATRGAKSLVEKRMRRPASRAEPARVE
jgi:hypothetical protein